MVCLHEKTGLSAGIGCETKFIPHMVGTPRRGVRASRRDAPTKEEFCLTPAGISVFHGGRVLVIRHRKTGVSA
jgi:hypothetical protein